MLNIPNCTWCGRLDQPWASCSHLCASATKQYNISAAKGRWCSAAGKVTAGLAKRNGSLPPCGWLIVEPPAGWLPVHRDQLWAQRSVTSMGSLYHYLFTRTKVEWRSEGIRRKGDCLGQISPQTASRSVQPFLQGSWTCPTDRQTHRPRYSVCSNKPYLMHWGHAMRPNNKRCHDSKYNEWMNVFMYIFRYLLSFCCSLLFHYKEMYFQQRTVLFRI